MSYHFKITGPIPGKKGHRGAVGGRIFTRPVVANRLKGIEAELLTEWARVRPSREPLPCVDVTIHFTVKDFRSDLDGKLTTLLDAMKNVRIIVDDNSMRVVGFQVTRTLARDLEEKAYITLLEREL